MIAGRLARRVLIAWVVGLIVLTGCAGSPPDLTPDAAERLQEAVNGVVQAAVEGRYDDAGAALLATRAALDEAADAGQVSAARYRQIEDALQRAEVELAAVVVAVEAPAPEEVPVADESAGSGGGGSGDNGPPDHSNAGGKDR